MKDIKNKDYQCKSCGKSLSSLQSLYGVTKITNAIYVGNHLLDQSLKKHIITIHESHKPYNSESCGKTFSQVGSLGQIFHKTSSGNSYSDSIRLF